jgi:hypothetical protein
MFASAKRSLLLVLLLLYPFQTRDRASNAWAERSPASSKHVGIRFRIATVEERSGKREIVSETVVKGPPGFDFRIVLEDAEFKMDARFLTDLVDANRLKIRAMLNTRRAYGVSERNLPLFEEDRQSQTLQVGFDDQIVLLPFGRGEGDKLKIEITPDLLQKAESPAEENDRLEIDMVKEAPGGQINVEATSLPHRFEVEAALLQDGIEIARGNTECLLEEPQELRLAPNSAAQGEAAENQLTIKLTVDRFARNRPLDNAWISFNASRISDSNPTEPIPVATNWAGVCQLGSDLRYDLTEYYLKHSDRKYELRFKVRLPPGNRDR